MYPETEQDRVNIEFATKWLQNELEKAKKKGKKGWSRLEPGIIPWVGKVGFNACVSALTGKKGIKDPRALCGALKREARSRGVLATKHMGRTEKKAALKRKK